MILAIHDIISSFLNFHWIDNTGFNLEETDYYGDYGDYGNYDIFDPVTQHDGCSGNVAKHNLCDVNSFPEEHLTQMTDFANLLKKNFCCKDHSYVALDECQVINDCSNNIYHIRDEISNTKNNITMKICLIFSGSNENSTQRCVRISYSNPQCNIIPSRRLPMELQTGELMVQWRFIQRKVGSEGCLEGIKGECFLLYKEGCCK